MIDQQAGCGLRLLTFPLDTVLMPLPIGRLP